MISDELMNQARRTFVEYERLFVERVAKRPGWKLDATHFEEVLRTGNEVRVRALIEDIEACRRDIESAVVV